MSVAQRVSVAEYLEQDNPRRSELLDGVVYVNEPTLIHQRICGRIWFALTTWNLSDDGTGETTLPLDVVLGDDVLAPDVLWFAEIPPADAPRAPGPPELVVEVRSPSTWTRDVGRKRQVYEAHGVSELWLVDTDSKSVLRFARSASSVARFDVEEELDRGQTLRTPLLPGFTLSLRELFQDPSSG